MPHLHKAMQRITLGIMNISDARFNIYQPIQRTTQATPASGRGGHATQPVEPITPISPVRSATQATTSPETPQKEASTNSSPRLMADGVRGKNIDIFV